MAGGVSCGLRHFVGATEGPEQALGIEAKVEDLSLHVENDEPRCATYPEIRHQARVAVHSRVVTERNRQPVSLLRLAQTFERVCLASPEYGLHGGEAEALAGQSFNQRPECRKSVTVTNRAPVLEAKDHLELVTEIGQL